MPTQPPRFGQRAGVPRKPWALCAGQQDRRLRGRAGVALRQRVRAEEPCCRLCLGRGLEVRTDEIDHIVPLSDPRWRFRPSGAADVRSNLQGLCEPCHDAKTADEARDRRA